MDWTDEALCAEIGIVLFFTEEGEPYARETADHARMACGLCPVRAECLETAMKFEAGVHRSRRHGIWGGLGPTQRWNLEQERKEE